jgi:hypothetical protein
MKSSEGRGRAIGLAPKLSRLTLEYQRLNTPEARVAFIDTWLRTWAYDFERTWPFVYKALEWVEKEELYKDPLVMNQDGSTPDFKSFFEVRLKRPFTLWFELEQTHHYVTKYAPELIDKTWGEARQRAAIATAEVMGKAPVAGAPKGGTPSHRLRLPTGSNSVARLAARLKRDAPEIAAAVERGEYPSMRAAAIAAGIIKPPTPYQVLCRAYKKASPADQQRFCEEHGLSPRIEAAA